MKYEIISTKLQGNTAITHVAISGKDDNFLASFFCSIDLDKKEMELQEIKAAEEFTYEFYVQTGKINDYIQNVSSQIIGDALNRFQFDKNRNRWQSLLTTTLNEKRLEKLKSIIDNDKDLNHYRIYLENRMTQLFDSVLELDTGEKIEFGYDMFDFWWTDTNKKRIAPLKSRYDDIFSDAPKMDAEEEAELLELLKDDPIEADEPEHDKFIWSEERQRFEIEYEI